MVRMYFNPSVAHPLPVGEPNRAPRDFHRRLPGYAITPLVSVPELAAKVGVGQVWVKDESNRLGLSSFKILGAWWATYQTLLRLFGQHLEPWSSLKELSKKLEPLRPLKLIAATDGNHGRAVAHIAALLGFASRIFVPSNTSRARIDAMASEGAEVVMVDGSYEAALSQAVKEQSPRCLLVQDVAWPGYEDIPRWVVEGYSTIYWEIDETLAAQGEPGPDLIVAQIGGGSFAASVVRHYRREAIKLPPRIVGIEPACAASTLSSMEAGHLVNIPGPHNSIMSGLNCGTVSLIAWPILKAGMDCFVAIGDDRVGEAMRFLAKAGLIAGETGAAGAACLLELLTGPQAEDARQRLRIDQLTRVLLISTEGATDPEAFHRIVD